MFVFQGKVLGLAGGWSSHCAVVQDMVDVNADAVIDIIFLHWKAEEEDV